MPSSTTDAETSSELASASTRLGPGIPLRRGYARAFLRLSLFWAAAIVLAAALYGAAWVILIGDGY